MSAELTSFHVGEVVTVLSSGLEGTVIGAELNLDAESVDYFVYGPGLDEELVYSAEELSTVSEATQDTITAVTEEMHKDSDDEDEDGEDEDGEDEDEDEDEDGEDE